MDQRVRNIIAFMNANIESQLSVRELAKVVHLSPSHFRRLFREQTGKPITRYLRDLRLQHSRHLLETTYLSVKEIATSVGLTSISHFVAQFKKAHGVTPSRFAARYRKTAESSPRGQRG
jgi:AraC family transcriptional regulator